MSCLLYRLIRVFETKEGSLVITDYRCSGEWDVGILDFENRSSFIPVPHPATQKRCVPLQDRIVGVDIVRFGDHCSTGGSERNKRLHPGHHRLDRIYPPTTFWRRSCGKGEVDG